MERIRTGIPLLLALSLLGALSFIVSPYFGMFSTSRSSRSYSRDEVLDDSSSHATTRGLMGGALGAAIGLIFPFNNKDEDDA